MNQHLASILAKVFGLRNEELTLDLSKENIGSWDSLKQMDLVITLEREFDLNLEIADIVQMTSIRAIVNVLTNKGVNLGA